MKLKVYLLINCFLACRYLLFGEIEYVEVKWKYGQECGPQCGQALTQQFQKINAVAQAYVNTGQGQVTLRWKPYFPFSYPVIQNALAMVGVSYDYIVVKARGTIQGNGSRFSIVSIGDNSQFILLGPAPAQPGRYVELENVASYPLSPYLKQKLAEGVQQNRIAIVQGPLLLPEQGPPYYIIIQDLKYLLASPDAVQQ